MDDKEKEAKKKALKKMLAGIGGHAAPVMTIAIGVGKKEKETE